MTALLEIEDLHTEIRLRRAAVRAVDGVSVATPWAWCSRIRSRR